jgi:hypothetical protein
MRYILLFLALFLQLNASGYTDDNPQNNCTQTVTGEYGQCAYSIKGGDRGDEVEGVYKVKNGVMTGEYIHKPQIKCG